MFEKLLDVLTAILHELKRSNDSRGGVDAAEVVEAPAKAAPAKAAPAKAAAKEKAAPALTLAEVQSAGGEYVAKHNRDKFVQLLKANGVPAVEGAYKLSAIKDDAAKLRKVLDAIKADLEGTGESEEL